MIVTETRLSQFKLLHRGKVRDVYELGDRLLIISTDRLSAFDYILPTPIPEKGKILTALSCYWFEKTQSVIANHLITTELPQGLSDLEQQALLGRTMQVKKAQRLPLEAIVRGYLTGSAWKDYQNNQHVNGIRLPSGLCDGAQLSEPLFTPSTKADVGEHDAPLTFDEVVQKIGGVRAEQVRAVALTLFKEASRRAQAKGLLIADTKMEFGLIDDQLILIDELLTPDSSRFWLASEYQPGKPLNPWDKQLVRDYLLQSDWDRQSPPPALPESIVNETQHRYQTIAQKLMS